MRAGRWIAACLSLPAMLPAAPATAQDYWHCTVLEEGGGVRAELTQDYFGPGQREIFPVQNVSASAGGVYFHTSSWPRWRSLATPFDLPGRITVGIQLPERAASRRISLFAPGVEPFSLQARLYGPLANQIGLSFDLTDRRRIEALLTHPDWTLITRHPDGRVQQILPVRIPMTIERLRALRERQVARMRELQRDPGRHCLLAEDPASIVVR